MHLFVISLLFILSRDISINSFEYRSSSQCTVVPCAQSHLVDCVSDKHVCFSFETINGTNVCAPASSCDLVEPCDQNGECLSKTSVCIVNSCCPQPICMPLLLTELCTSESSTTTTTTTMRPSTIRSRTRTAPKKNPLRKVEIEKDHLTAMIHAKICPDATWSQTSTIVASFSDINPQDFSINNFDEIFIPDELNHTIRKYSPDSSTKWSKPLGSTYLSQPTSIFVDLSDNIYIWDSEKYQVNFWSSSNRNLRTLLSFDQCKNSAQFNQICYANSIVADENRTIYISESSNAYSHTNRVMKFQFNTTVGHVIAGTSRSGSAANQLDLPQTILLDADENLYVADIGNSRIQKFSLGQRNGKTIASIAELIDFTMDTNGDLYALTQSDNTIQRIRQMSMYQNKENIIRSVQQSSRIHFGFDGSIYVLNEKKKSIDKFEIINNHC